MKSNVYLASKPRYEILDGLRGVAAVLVVTYHLFETLSCCRLLFCLVGICHRVCLR